MRSARHEFKDIVFSSRVKSVMNTLVPNVKVIHAIAGDKVIV